MKTNPALIVAGYLKYDGCHSYTSKLSLFY